MKVNICGILHEVNLRLIRPLLRVSVMQSVISQQLSVELNSIQRCLQDITDLKMIRRQQMNNDNILEKISKTLLDEKVTLMITFPQKSMRAYFESNIKSDPLIVMYLIICAFKEQFKEVRKMDLFKGENEEDILDSIFEYIEGILFFEDILSKEDEEAADEEQ